ncbi:MAG TPA: farnesyl diphosphate synthase [Gemmatimonadaceae bacterium]|nr:farnesyl diphosphate synthase [Gemmatimonadaceae bacterium]
MVNSFFSAERARIESMLSEVCSAHLPKLAPPISAAVEYGIRSPGKRIRPLLLLFAYGACRGKGDAAMLACAPEIIHSYSLVHDDLPCMDDDDMRRGRPTVHKVHGSRTAIVAGAAMIPFAVAVARDGLETVGAAPGAARRTVAALLEGAGAGGMIGGQLRDLAGEGALLSLEEREAVHAAKTGALIAASVRMGALAAGADDAQVEAADRYGRSIGLAFQIMDDVLDLTSTTVALGKTAGRDAALKKSTYPALLGVDGARQRAEALIERARDALQKVNLLTPELSQVANFMLTRTS